MPVGIYERTPENGWRPGRPKKVYPEALVRSVQRLYGDGQSQEEVALALGVGKKVVYVLMRNHGIPTRPQAKRDQVGDRNASWKGDEAKYAGLHRRVALVRGKPSVCEDCGSTIAKRYEWANLTGHYEDPADYRRLCVSCHHRMDGTIKNLRQGA